MDTCRPRPPHPPGERRFHRQSRVVGNGYDGHGREVLTYIPGDFVHPHAWSDEGIWHVGRLLRDLHDATAGFQPPPDAVWHPWPFHSDAPDAIISHRDTGPWNIVARDGLPVAFIDWPTAGPTDRLDEIAATAWLNAQLHDDDIAERQNLPEPPPAPPNCATSWTATSWPPPIAATSSPR